MSRLQVLLTVLIVALLGVLFWFLVFTPQQDEIADLEVSIEAQEAQQATLRNRIAELRQVRADAPEAEATLAAAGAIVPLDSSLPSALRQLQSAANDSGITLRSVGTARPTVLDGDLGLSNITLSVQLEGSYFQAVDFLRRIEEPAVTPRGIVWNSANMTRSEFPRLNISLSGNLFTRAEPSAEPEEEEADEETTDAGEGELLDQEDDQ